MGPKSCPRASVQNDAFLDASYRTPFWNKGGMIVLIQCVNVVPRRPTPLTSKLGLKRHLYFSPPPGCTPPWSPDSQVVKPLRTSPSSSEISRCRPRVTTGLPCDKNCITLKSTRSPTIFPDLLSGLSSLSICRDYAGTSGLLTIAYCIRIH